MNVQTQKKTSRTRKRAAKQLGNGEVAGAQRDIAVVRMISAEVEKRSDAIQAMIADAAYFRAEKRGFDAGRELDDWLAAEAEVAQLVQQQGSPSSSPGRSP